MQRQYSFSSQIRHPYRHLIFGPQIEAGRFKRHLIACFKGIIYAVKCLQPPSMKFVEKK